MALMKKLTSAIVASSLVLGLVGTAGATTPDKVQAAALRMKTLKLVQGVNEAGELDLNANLTRAQLVTILVRAFGQDANAKYLNGAAAFPDTANHPWASGYIAMAKRIIADRSAGKESVGLPDGTFNPDGNVTAAEAVAFLMKFVGAPKDESQAWPMNYIQGALNAGLITAEDKAVLEGIKNAPATRGLAFYLADRTFFGYKLTEGGTVYTTFVDATKPALTVDSVAATTLEDKVTITGTVAADAVVVHVGSMDKTATIADGKFTATVDLKVGENAILVHAVDLAGNASETSVKVTRTVGAAATIEAADITVAAGATAEVKAVVKDAKGNVIADAAVTAETTVGTYADGKFTAGEKAAEGTLTLKVGEVTKAVKVTVTAGALAKVETSAASVAPGKAITLVAKDQYGNAVTGATFSQTSADALLDATTGNFIATKAGTYTVKATKDGVTVEGKVGVFGDISKFVVSAPATVVANGATEIKVTASAVDKDGNIVAGYDKDVTIGGLLTAEKATVKAVSGVATFTLTAGADLADSTVDIAVTSDHDADAATADKEGKTSIEAQAQVATSIKVTAPEYVPTNDATVGKDVTVEVLDQAGEAMVDGAWEFAVTLTGPATLESGKDTKTGSKSLTASANTFAVYPTESGEAGTVKVAVSFTGLTAGEATSKAVYAQDAKSLKVTTKTAATTVESEANLELLADASENYVEFSISTLDKNGVPTDVKAPTEAEVKFEGLTDDDKAVTYLGVYNGTTYDYTAIATLANTKVTLTNGAAKFRVAGEVAKTFKVSVVDPAEDIASSAVTDVALNAGAPASIGFSKSFAAVLRGATETTATLTAQLYDAFGNKAAKAGVELEIKSVDNDAVGVKAYDGVKVNGKDEAVTVTTDATGAASATVSFQNFQSYATFTVTGSYDGTELADKTSPTDALDVTEESSVQVVTTIPTNITAEILDASATSRLSSYKAGTDVDSNGDDGIVVRLTAKDNYGRVITNLWNATHIGDYGIKLTSSDDDIDLSTVTWTQDTDGVYVSSPIVPTKAGTFTVTAEVQKLAAELKVSKSVSVKPGDAAAIKLAEAKSDKTLEVTADKVGEYTVQLTDKYGNVVTSAQANKTLFVVFGATVNTGAGEYASFRNSSGAEITYLKLPVGYNSAKFSFVSNVTKPTITFTVYQDELNGNGKYDGTETQFGEALTINAPVLP